MTNDRLLWAIFGAIVVVVMALDLGVFHRRSHTVKFKEAVVWSVVWILLALGFMGLVHHWRGPQPALEFLTGYLIEESLSIDNLFVFLLVFGSLGIALRYQRKVLFWGILGAIVMRGAFIFAGVAVLERFTWVMYIFGALLVFTAIKLLRSNGIQADPQRNPLVRLTRRFFPVASDYTGNAFTVRRAGGLLLTPLAIALVAVESADLVFAVDSVPAVLAVSDDVFVVFTSNVAAILGLRSLYFALAGSLQRFEYLSWGLAVVLGFVGAKMLLADFVHIPIYMSLTVIAIAVGGSIVASLWLTRGRDKPAPLDAAAPSKTEEA